PVGPFHHPDARRGEVGVPGKLRVDRGHVSDQRDADIEVREGGEGAIDDLAWGVIAAHGVDCDPNHAAALTAKCSVLNARCRVRVLGALYSMLRAGCSVLLLVL